MEPGVRRFKGQVLLGNILRELITPNTEEKQQKNQEASVEPRHAPCTLPRGDRGGLRYRLGAIRFFCQPSNSFSPSSRSTSGTKSTLIRLI